MPETTYPPENAKQKRAGIFRYYVDAELHGPHYSLILEKRNALMPFQ